MIILKSEREINYMRDAGKLVAGTLQELGKVVAPDITTGELDQVAEDFIVRHGAKPAFKGLYGFPATACISVNEQVVHGIPGLRKLKTGDNVSIDVGVEINGYFGDAAHTYGVGEVDPEVQRLMDITEQSLYEGINQAVHGNRLSDISHTIQEYVESNGFSVVREYVGHGVGRDMHEEPQIPNYGLPGRGPRLQPGMTLAIEPMVNVGKYHVQTLQDGWTVVTKDRSRSAHFEHTIAITSKGTEILTKL